MSKKLLLQICFSLAVIQMAAQETYWKIIDISGEANEEPWDMEIRNDTVFMWGLGTCEGYPCMHYYQFSKEGDSLLIRTYPGLIPGRRVDMQDSCFYMPVRYFNDPLEGTTGFRLAQFNLDGDLIKTAKYDLDDLENGPEYEDDFYYSYGCIKYGSKIVVYGQIIDVQDDEEDWQTCMFWYNEEDLSLDTIIFIDPKENTFRTWDAVIDNNGLLTFLVEYRIPVPLQDNGDYIVYVKYDKDGELVEFWDGPEWSGRYRHCPLEITDENDLIFVTDDDFSANDLEVHKIDQDGTVQWREHVDPKQVDFDRRGLLDINISQDKNIIGCGLHYSNIAELDGAYLCKLNKQTGDLLWERTYLDWRETLAGDVSSIRMTLFNISEFSDGSLFVAGARTRRVLENSNVRSIKDLLIMRLDEDGCIEPGCGGTKQHLIGEPAYDHLLTPESLRYYQEYGAGSGIIKHTIEPFDFLPRPTYTEAWTEEFLDPREDRQYEHWTNEIYFIEEDGRKIFYTGDGKEELLYDFTLEVGDLFESEYISQPLRVIESDTMRLSNRAKMRYWVLACTENPSNTITWMEGIGTYHGVQWPRNFCEGDYGDRNLTCFYRFERLAHMNPDVSGCLMPSSTDDHAFLLLSEIKAYPNPTRDLLTLTAPADLHIERTELLDTQGRTHTQFHEKTSEVRLDLSGYPSGLYFVSVHTREGSVVKKVVVSR